MALEALAEALPDYAKDHRLNLPAVLAQTELSPVQIWGTAVTSALATGNEQVIRAVLAEASSVLSSEQIQAAKIAASLMAMNNVYYRFCHLSGNENYQRHPARLRMNAMRSHGADPLDFELWSLAVSAINGCGLCVESHEKVVREKGMSEEQVLAAIRVASVIKAVADVLRFAQASN